MAPSRKAIYKEEHDDSMANKKTRPMGKMGGKKGKGKGKGGMC